MMFKKCSYHFSKWQVSPHGGHAKKSREASIDKSYWTAKLVAKGIHGTAITLFRGAHYASGAGLAQWLREGIDNER